VPAVYRTEINDTAHSTGADLTQWTKGHPYWWIWRHGEAIANDIDLSRTIGWFTTIFPVLLTWRGFPARGGTEGIKEQLRSVPNRGIGYGVLRYLSGDTSVTEQLQIPKPR